jgi:Spy/CpxP family protein refolding chaperone
MKSFRASLMVPMFALFASLAACSGQAQTDGSAQTNNAVTNAAAEGKPASSHMRGPMMGGPGMLVFAALHEDSLKLTDAQRTTIQAAADTLKPKGPPPGAEAHGKALAAAVRAGKIDTATLAKADVAPAMESEHKTALVNALNVLHKTLTKEQRVALVAAVQSHKGKHGPMNGDAPKGEHEGMKHHKGGEGHAFGPMHMLKDLDLTADQQTAIEKELQANKPAKPTEAERDAMKAQHEAFKKELDARLQTFANDDFDANAYVAPIANAPKMHHGDRFVTDLAAIVPLLTPAQREKLATKLEKGPAAFAPPAPAAK